MKKVIGGLNLDRPLTDAEAAEVIAAELDGTLQRTPVGIVLWAPISGGPVTRVPTLYRQELMGTILSDLRKIRAAQEG